MSGNSQQQLSSMWMQGWNWLQSRVDIEGVTQAMLHIDIPKGIRTYFLGGTTLFFLGVQVITGILLALYYRASPEEAYQSILYIMNEVPFGWLIRSIHAWSANMMIITCVLHMLRVFFQGAYKAPRELTWIVGVLLLLITLTFGFTGYLLPWDQRAYWATTVGTEIAGAVPLIGDPMLLFLRGGSDLSGLTLARFHSIHTLVLPLSVAVAVMIHLFIIHQQGLAPLPDVNEPSANEEKAKP
jgi:quinol-cytochrome oxidoreductase complex cytochrome b subunit